MTKASLLVFETSVPWYLYLFNPQYILIWRNFFVPYFPITGCEKLNNTVLTDFRRRLVCRFKKKRCDFRLSLT